MMCLQELLKVMSAKRLGLVHSVQEGRNDSFVEMQQNQLHFILLPVLYVLLGV